MKDNEWAGVGNSLDYGFRMEDTRIARFRSVDPLSKQYPMLTPYQFASNSPIWGIDRDGLEFANPMAQATSTWSGKTAFFVLQAEDAILKCAGGAISYLTGGGPFRHDKNAPSIKDQVNGTLHPPLVAVDGILKDPGNGGNWGTLAFTAFAFKIAKETENPTAIIQGEFIGSSSVRFSQKSINGYGEVAKSMAKNGWQGDPIDIVMMKDGAYTTMDNTRLAAAQDVGIEVKVNKHSYSEKLSETMQERFEGKGKNGSNPTTWGDAIEGRISNQGKTFSKDNPQGATVQPEKKD